MDRRKHDRRTVEPYVGFIHARLFNDLFAADPRGAWQAAYRRARRAGNQHLPPAEILARYPVSDYPVEFGIIESFRFILN